MLHKRGVYQELDAPRGWVVFKVFNCAGRRISRNEVPEDLADDAMFHAVERWLDQKCPLGHLGPCPSAEPTPVSDVPRMIVVSQDHVAAARPSAPHLPRLRLESSA